jgi:hypothetical protein
MKLDFLMLADGASSADAKVYIHGGAITRVYGPALPFGPIPIAIIARLLVEEADRNTSPEFTVEVLRPDGSALLPPVTGQIPGAPFLDVSQTGEERGVVIVLNAFSMFDVSGVHRVVFRLDGEVLAERPLLAVVAADESAPPAPSY